MMIRGQNTPVAKKSKTKRCLFGKPDPKELDQFLDQNLAQVQKEKAAEIKAKFNFDVQSERPLKLSSDSIYEWDQITQAPGFYKTTNGKRKSKDDLNRVDAFTTKGFEATGKAEPTSTSSATTTTTTTTSLKSNTKTIQKPKLTLRSSNIAGQKRSLKSTTQGGPSQPQTTLQLPVVRRSTAKKAKTISTRCMR